MAFAAGTVTAISVAIGCYVFRGSKPLLLIYLISLGISLVLSIVSTSERFSHKQEVYDHATRLSTEMTEVQEILYEWDNLYYNMDIGCPSCPFAPGQGKCLNEPQYVDAVDSHLIEYFELIAITSMAHTTYAVFIYGLFVLYADFIKECLLFVLIPLIQRCHGSNPTLAPTRSPTPTPTIHPDHPKILGALVGAILGSVGIWALTMCWCQQKKKKMQRLEAGPIALATLSCAESKYDANFGAAIGVLAINVSRVQASNVSWITKRSVRKLISRSNDNKWWPKALPSIYVDIRNVWRSNNAQFGNLTAQQQCRRIREACSYWINNS